MDINEMLTHLINYHRSLVELLKSDEINTRDTMEIVRHINVVQEKISVLLSLEEAKWAMTYADMAEVLMIARKALEGEKWLRKKN